MEAIALSGVQIVRDGTAVVEIDDLKVAVGERVGIMGASGSGKTSLLRVVAGLDAPVAGSVRLLGDAVRGPGRRATLIFSEDSVYDHLDVAGNLDFPLEVTGRKGDRAELIGLTADAFWLRQLLERDPATLSVGQRQVVAAARAVVRPEVEVVLVDEPLVGTDPHRRIQLMDGVMGRPGFTVMFATNDPADVHRWARRVVVLAGGRVAQDGTPKDIYAAPVSLEVAELLGEFNRFPGRVGSSGVVEVAGSTLRLDGFPARLGVGEPVVVGVRPEAVRLAAPGIPFDRRLRATVGRVEGLGSRTRVLFGLGGQAGVSFVAETADEPALAPGATVDWYLAPDAVGLFDPLSGRRL